VAICHGSTPAHGSTSLISPCTHPHNITYLTRPSPHPPTTPTQINKIPKNYTATFADDLATLAGKPALLNKTTLVKDAVKMLNVTAIKGEVTAAVAGKVAKLTAEIDAIEVREERERERER